MPMVLSIEPSAVEICLMLTSPLLTTMNAIGVMVMPAPPPPPKSSAFDFDGKSEPPDAKP